MVLNLLTCALWQADTSKGGPIKIGNSIFRTVYFPYVEKSCVGDTDKSSRKLKVYD